VPARVLEELEEIEEREKGCMNSVESGRKHKVLLDRKWGGGLVSKARSRQVGGNSPEQVDEC